MRWLHGRYQIRLPHCSASIFQVSSVVKSGTSPHSHLWLQHSQKPIASLLLNSYNVHFELWIMLFCSSIYVPKTTRFVVLDSKVPKWRLPWRKIIYQRRMFLMNIEKLIMKKTTEKNRYIGLAINGQNPLSIACSGHILTFGSLILGPIIQKRRDSHP